MAAEMFEAVMVRCACHLLCQAVPACLLCLGAPAFLALHLSCSGVQPAMQGGSEDVVTLFLPSARRSKAVSHLPAPAVLQGAIYLDSDLEAVRRCYLAHFPLPDDPLMLLQVRVAPRRGVGVAAARARWALCCRVYAQEGWALRLLRVALTRCPMHVPLLRSRCCSRTARAASPAALQRQPATARGSELVAPSSLPALHSGGLAQNVWLAYSRRCAGSAACKYRCAMIAV